MPMSLLRPEAPDGFQHSTRLFGLCTDNVTLDASSIHYTDINNTGWKGVPEPQQDVTFISHLPSRPQSATGHGEHYLQECLNLQDTPQDSVPMQEP